MGNSRVTKQNLKIVDVDLNNNLLAIKGSIPGKKILLYLSKMQLKERINEKASSRFIK